MLKIKDNGTISMIVMFQEQALTVFVVLEHIFSFMKGEID
jgi:hypothetical protein